MFIFRFKALATCCFALSLFFNLFGDLEQDRFVKNHFPGAQMWFEKMSQKYPVAELEKVSFCISDIYLSRANTIYWPEDRLRAIDAAYTNKNCHDLENMFKQDEYILLHEAAHILKNHNEKGYIALALTCAAFASFNGYIIQKAFTKETSGLFNKVHLSVQALLGNITIFSALAFYVQIQEHEADDFANQYGDEGTLQAGASWLMRIEKCMLKDKKYAPLMKELIIIYQDPWHPSPKIRYQKIVDALATHQKIAQSSHKL